MKLVGSGNLWFPIIKPDELVKIRLFCLPFAGGNASTYRLWQNHFPDFVDVCPIQLPGRSNRINEDCISDFSLLANLISSEITPFTNVPFSFFGHSMGALIGFEVIRSLINKGKIPVHFFPSGAKAPDSGGRKFKLHNLDNEQLKEELKKLRGTPQEILEHPELFELLLPILRADFKIVDDYYFTPGQKLPCPVTVFGGYDDEVSQHDLSQWKTQTDADFRVRMFEGNHFFLNEQTSALSGEIYYDLSNYL